MELLYLPVIPTRGIVIFPGTHVTFDVGRNGSKGAIDEAFGDNKNVFVTAQKMAANEKVKADELYTIGTVSKIEQVLRLPNGLTRVVIRGIKRAKIESIAEDDSPVMHVTAYELDTIDMEDSKKQAYMRILRDEYKKYFSVNHKMNADKYMSIMSFSDPELLCDIISAEMKFDIDIKQQILEECDLTARIEKLIVSLSNETEIVQLENEIGVKVKENIDKNQREYYLREQMKVISTELGGDIAGETEEYRERIEKLKLKAEVKEKLLKEVDRLSKMHGGSSDSSVIRTYLDTVLALPWNKTTKENLDIENAKKVLDEDHYGLFKVKERITEYLAVRALKKGQGQILCLSGPPGVGKTSVAKSVARALNRKFVRISLGGIHDEADIRGHRKTYIGAMAGRIMEAVSRAGSNNALILLDEIDKMGTDYKGDPSAALLEVLDAEQNMAFRDHYIEVPFDLSKVMFIATANTCRTLSAPLLDRLEVIELSGYTTEEKLHIGRKYLLPRAMDNAGLNNKQLVLGESAMRDIIEYYTREAGVRQLEREFSSIARKVAKKVVTGEKEKVTITKNNLVSYLGQKRYSFISANEKPEIGIVRGLAWTAVGGDTLSVEVNIMDGTGKTELTGKLGDVMKESAVAAISYVRSKASELGIDSSFYKKKDIHIHVPEGAVPKDGPSAGITIATALSSALSKKAVRNDIAMTGEITIRGRVLAIGGLKEKVLAAYRAGINTVILPKENEKDISEIPLNVRKKIRFVPVETMDEVLEEAIVR